MSRSASSRSAPALADRTAPSCSRGGASTLAQQALSPQDIAALSKAREARWRPGLEDQPLHTELFAGTHDAIGAGAALALARDALRVAADREDPLAEPHDRRQVLWVQEARAIERGGRPYLHGLPRDLRERLIHVAAKTPEDALFALEEGLRCRDLACVIGEVLGNPRALDFTASRRLSLAAEKHGVALWLVRLDARADLSSARMRWRIEAAPSIHPPWNADAPGTARWSAELFRARAHAPGQWILTDDDKALRADKPGADHDRALEHSDDQHDEPRSAWHGQSGPGAALARHYRLQHSAGAPVAANSGHMVRATVGRSLAACARM